MTSQSSEENAVSEETAVIIDHGSDKEVRSHEKSGKPWCLPISLWYDRHRRNSNRGDCMQFCVSVKGEPAYAQCVEFNSMQGWMKLVKDSSRSVSTITAMSSTRQRRLRRQRRNNLMEVLSENNMIQVIQILIVPDIENLLSHQMVKMFPT